MFERACIWTEFHHGKDDKDTQNEQIFKKNKTNLPQKYTVPEDLKIFLNAVKSEISDPRNRSQETCNLPVEEFNAMNELMRLQKEKIIVIKACDKGAGIIILDYSDYMQACYSHLTSFQTENRPYYTQVDDFEVERGKKQNQNGA